MKGQTDFEFIADAGYFVCVRMQFASPLFSQYRMPPKWLESYTAQGMILSDPLMLWAHQNTGITRWSEVDLPDPQGILDHALRHGLPFGAVASCFDDYTSERSLGIFATTGDEFSDESLDHLLAGLTLLHDTRMRPIELNSAEADALRLLRDGKTVSEIAESTGIAESAVSMRLDVVLQKLGARSYAHAISIAEDAGLL